MNYDISRASEASNALPSTFPTEPSSPKTLTSAPSCLRVSLVEATAGISSLCNCVSKTGRTTSDNARKTRDRLRRAPILRGYYARSTNCEIFLPRLGEMSRLAELRPLQTITAAKAELPAPGTPSPSPAVSCLLTNARPKSVSSYLVLARACHQPRSNAIWSPR